MFKSVGYKVLDHILGQKDESPRVIAMLDGGICSQMYQYLLGHLYAKKGYCVSHDLTFYANGGADINGEFARNFDLEKAFPSLRVDVATQKDIKRYKKRHSCSGNYSDNSVVDYAFLNKRPPLYLGNYYLLPSEIFLPAFHELYTPSPDVLDAPNRKLYEQISAQPAAVGVHVRRGDLKIELQSYGKPASQSYFQQAVNHMRNSLEQPFFYFFSDEPQWVASELIPQLGIADCSQLVDLNGSDKGYMDLIQLAACKHQITSKGSLGKFGALMADNDSKIVTLCNDRTEYRWGELMRNPVYL